LLGDAKSSLGNAESSLGDAKSSLGDAKSFMGDAKSSLGRVHVVAQWMVYAREFGHAGFGLSGFVHYHDDPLATIETVFVQPNTTAVVEVPVAKVSRELFAKYGVTEANICEEDPVVYAFLAGAAGRTASTAIYR
jgi:hypothetical protein